VPAVAAAFAAAALGGGLWALLAGVLKTRGGVNEIFAGLGLNFVAQGVILWLIFGPWKRPGIASMSGTAPFPTGFWLAYSTPARVSLAAVTLAVAAVVLSGLLLGRTRVGLNLKAVGNNAAAARLFGLRPGRWMLVAMAFAGGFAGIAGAFQVTGVYHRLIPAISSNYGYLALMCVMLANYRPVAAPLVALLFAVLNVGGIQLPMVLQLDSSLSGVIQGALVLTTLAVYGWRRPGASGER
jgi:simple sugar transport system permease protein